MMMDGGVGLLTAGVGGYKRAREEGQNNPCCKININESILL